MKTTSRTHKPPKRSARRTALLVEQGCKYSHIPTSVSQELLSDTEHVQEQCSEITLNMFGSVHKRHRQDHTPTTTKGWRSALTPHWASRHIGGFGKDTHGTPMTERRGRGWPTTRSTVRQTCTTKKDTHHCLQKHTVPENSGTGNGWRRKTWEFQDFKHFRRSLQAEQIVLLLKNILCLLFRASPVDVHHNRKQTMT